MLGNYIAKSLPSATFRGIVKTMKIFAGMFLSAALAGGLFFLFAAAPKEVLVNPTSATGEEKSALESLKDFVGIPEASTLNSPPKSAAQVPTGDLPPQPQLANPPAIAKAIYITSWSAGSPGKMNSLIGLVKRTELNAVVIDIKDYSGYVAYTIDAPEIQASGALDQLRILRPNTLIRRLHDEGIYVIGRISVFQDPILAKAHPEWAVKNKTTGKLWTDRKGLSWMDPASEKVWEYNIAIAKDAIARGFDEINFDYVRFPSDGDLEAMFFSSWDAKTPRHTVLRRFFGYIRDSLPEAKFSADLFGLATVNNDDLGIGQVIEDAYQYFDYVAPMIYPSHYAAGFNGFKNPAAHPYDVVYYSLEKALGRLVKAPLQNGSTTASSSSAGAPAFRAKLRPWLQDFNLGAVYDAEMVRKQIQAVSDVLGTSTVKDHFTGWYLWNPSNNYTEGALFPET